jgi:hypothetical protein
MLPPTPQLYGSTITPYSLPQSAPQQPSANGASGSSVLGAIGGFLFGNGSPSASQGGSSSGGSSGLGDTGQIIGAAKLGGSLTGNSGLSTAAGLAGNALAIYSGLKQGGVAGYAGAGISGLTAANKVDSLATGSGFLSGGEAAGLGAAGSALGLYNGIKQGGVAGYGSAAINAAQLYGAASAADTAAGGAGFAGGAAAGSAAGLIALPVGVAMYGASKPAVQLDSTYWGNIDNTLSTALTTGGGLNPNASVQQQLQAVTALQTLQGYMGGSGNQGAGGVAGADPALIMKNQLAPYGITDPSQINDLVDHILNNLNGAMPGQAAGEQSAHGGDLGITGRGTQAY